MRFTFRTEAALSALARLKNLQRPPENLQELAASFGPAITPLDFFIETSIPLRALNDGMGDPKVNLLLLQEKIDQVKHRFTDLFPPGNEYSLSDLVQAHFDLRALPPFSFRETLLRTGSPYLSTEDLPPMILGGFFVFCDGRWGEVEWDNRLLYEIPPFPLTIPHLDLKPRGRTLLSNREDLLDWNDVLKYQTELQQALDLPPESKSIKYRSKKGAFATVTFDTDNRLLYTQIQIVSRDGNTELIAARTFYDLSGKRKQDGVVLLSKPNTDYLTSDRWRIIESNGDIQPELDPLVQQFFFLPGAVWEVNGHLGRVEEFQAASITERVNSARIFLKKRHSTPMAKSFADADGRGEKAVTLRVAEEEEHRWQITFDTENEKGIPVAWRVVSEKHPAITSIEMMPVTDENIDSIESYIREKALAARDLFHEIRALSPRLNPKGK